jgi:hypothetical protein
MNTLVRLKPDATRRRTGRVRLEPDNAGRVRLEPDSMPSTISLIVYTSEPTNG